MIKSLICLAQNVPSTGKDLFYDSNIRNATLFVPRSALDVYKSTDPWRFFGTIDAIVPEIELNETELLLHIGETASLSANITPENTENVELKWTSSNEDIVMVTAKGKVIAVAEGTATVTVELLDESGATATCEVNVLGTPVSSIVISQNEATILPNERLQLTVTLLPEDAGNKDVIWKSDNEDVAAVNNKGLVIALEVGTAIISATTTDGSNLSANCIVTVIKEPDGIKNTTIQNPVEYFTLDGSKVSTPNKAGTYLVKKGIETKMVVLKK